MAPKLRARGGSSSAAGEAAAPQSTGTRQKGRKGSTGASKAATAQAPAAAAAPPGGMERVGRRKKADVEGSAAAAAAATADALATEAVKDSKPKRQRKEVVVPEPDVLCFSTEPGVRVGTSGYQYKHWRGGEQAFYGGLPQRLEWDRYVKEFDFVELNATFYGWFDHSTFDKWRGRAAAVRPTFQYAVKAPQLYTHRKRLNIDNVFIDSWGRFWERCQRLRPHMGPILFQFPANFRTTSQKGQEEISNIDKLRRLGEVLPAGEKFVFEFRDSSWLCREVYDVLRQHDWCLAIVHCTDGPNNQKLEEGGWIGSLSPGPNPPPEEYPADCCSWGVYVRMHGSMGQYRGAHGATELRKWAAWAKRWRSAGRHVYFAFNNDTVDQGSHLPSAILDCRELAAALRRNGVWPS